MVCPLCDRRKARRHCPALDRRICPVCCGTKRQVEIACPPDCAYLASARRHPPAVVQRRQERDMEFLWTCVQGLSERQSHLFIALQTVVRRFAAGAVPPLADQDVAEASASVASTLETAERGIIYEHQPTSLQAQGLASELRGILEKLTKDAPSSVQRETAAVLRRIERAARTSESELGDGPRTYLEVLGRLPADPEPTSEASRLVGSEAASSSGGSKTGTGSAEPEGERGDPPRLIVP